MKKAATSPKPAKDPRQRFPAPSVNLPPSGKVPRASNASMFLMAADEYLPRVGIERDPRPPNPLPHAPNGMNHGPYERGSRAAQYNS